MCAMKAPKKVSLWSFGVWLVLLVRTQEVHPGTREGIVRACMVHRMGACVS